MQQQRIDELAKQSEKPAVSLDQFKVVIKGMHGEPILPTDEDFAGVEEPELNNDHHKLSRKDAHALRDRYVN
jgi:hypothetical protein